MLEAYSLNVTIPANSAITFNNVTLKKGCTAELLGNGTIQLNKCGIYMIECDASSAASTTIQLFKDNVAQSQAQSTGSSLSFTTLVQVTENNSCCPCTSPTVIQVKNVGTASSTFTDANIVVTKVV